MHWIRLHHAISIWPDRLARQTTWWCHDHNSVQQNDVYSLEPRQRNSLWFRYLPLSDSYCHLQSSQKLLVWFQLRKSYIRSLVIYCDRQMMSNFQKNCFQWSLQETQYHAPHVPKVNCASCKQIKLYLSK